MRTSLLLTLTALGLATPALAADHADGPAAAADATADIADLFAWMTPDATKLNLAVTLATNGIASPMFSDAVTYAFHVNSSAGYGMTATETMVTCSFYDGMNIECWAGDAYVTGDASAAAGITSSDGALKVYAGVRNDPFFFNLDGFVETVETVKSVAGDLTFDDDGCPAVDAATSTALVTQLQTTPDGDPAEDTFAGTNVLALVVQIDKTKINSGGDVLGIWASTHVQN